MESEFFHSRLGRTKAVRIAVALLFVFKCGILSVGSPKHFALHSMAKGDPELAD